MRYYLDTSVIIAFYTEVEVPIILEEFSKYNELIIPSGVIEELREGVTWRMFKESIKYYKIRIVENIPSEIEIYKTYLGKGELQVIALSYLDKESFACLDDKRARKLAEKMGVKVRGTLGIIKDAMNLGIISRKFAIRICEKLKISGFRFKGSCKDIF